MATRLRFAEIVPYQLRWVELSTPCSPRSPTTSRRRPPPRPPPGPISGEHMRRGRHGPRVQPPEPRSTRSPPPGSQTCAGIGQGPRLRPRRTAGDHRAVSRRVGTGWWAACRTRAPCRARPRRPSARKERLVPRSGARRERRDRRSNAIRWPLRAPPLAGAIRQPPNSRAQLRIGETMCRLRNRSTGHAAILDGHRRSRPARPKTARSFAN